MAALKGEKIVARLLNRRGSRLNLPQPLEPGELGWCLDTKQLFVGLDADNAIAAIQAFNNVDTSDVNDILNNYIVQIKSPWIRLKTPTNPTSGNPDEYEALMALATIPPSSFILEHNTANIRAAETKISYLSLLRYNMLGFLQTHLNSNSVPYTMVYDWVESAPMAATGTPVTKDGAVATVTLTSGGTGYAIGEVLTMAGGTGAGLTLTVTGESGGVITSVDITTSGADYTVADPLTVSSSTLAGNDDATFNVATIDNGVIASVTMNSHGRGYLGGQTVGLSFGGTGTNAAGSATVDQLTGNVIVSISNGGSGYTTATATFDIPTATSAWNSLDDIDGIIRTGNVFQFTVFLGFGNNPPMDSGLNLGLDDLITSLNDAAFTFAQSSENASDPSPYQFCISTAGIMGTNVLAPLDYGYQMQDGVLYLSTVRQTSNLAGLINKLCDPTSSGLVTTKQNVEIVTEQSTALLSEMLNDFFIENPLCYSLPPTAVYPAAPTTYDPVENDGSNPLYSSPILIYDYGVNDVQDIEYSIIDDTQKMLRSGKLRVNTLDTGVAMVEDEYTENRDGTITPVSSGGPDFDFNATVTGQDVTIEYRHNFVGYVDVKISTRRWKSFNV
jgi:hypothetical protein